jgi:hypothetical protein
MAQDFSEMSNHPAKRFELLVDLRVNYVDIK